MKYIYIIVILIISKSSYAQSLGCPDPQASNYDASATQNDGSCIYPSTNYNPSLVAQLDSAINETSALVYYDNYLWTLNDGGNLPFIYKLNPNTGAIEDSIWLAANNNDWEALALDANYLYIGDFGNNYGNRTNLKILKIALTDLLNNDTVSATSINFSYPEQVDFTANLNNTAFDAEAFFVKEDSIYLFTKNWIENNTQLYVLPKQPGSYQAKLIASLASDGLVTDASYDAIMQRIVLIGYKKGAFGSYTSFAFLLFDFPNTNILGGNKRRIGLSNVLELGQTEGISWSDLGKGFISGEKIVQTSLNINEPAKLHHFDFNLYFQNAPSKIKEMDKASLIKIYPNPTNNSLIVHLDRAAQFNIVDSEGKIIKPKIRLLKGKNEIDITALNSGKYILSSTDISAPFIKE